MKFLLNEPINNYIKIRQLDEFMVGHKGYIAGGAFKNIFNNEKVKDVDIFFESKRDFEEALEYYKKDDRYKAGYENEKVVSFIHKERKILVELIRHKFKSPIEMIKEFDFTITQFVYYKEYYVALDDEEDEVTWRIAFNSKFFEHLYLKRLVIEQDFNDLILPVNTFNRMFRYAKYGYFPCRETKVKIIEALRELPNFSEELLALGLYDGMD